MRPVIRLALALTMALASALATARAAAAQAVVHTFNGDQPQACCYYTAFAVGWHYTPETPFVLTGIRTRFGAPIVQDGEAPRPYAPRDVTVQVREAPDGAVLRSATFTTLPSTDWVGGTFDGLALAGGTSYFLAFLNVAARQSYTLRPNVTQAPGTADFGATWIVLDEGEAFRLYADLPNDPILELSGVAATTATTAPEPAPVALLGTGVAVLLAARRRVSRAATPCRSRSGT